MDVTRYLAIPYLPMGRTEEGCDCYGLVRLVLLEQFGKTLPLLTYGSDDRKALLDEQVSTLSARAVTKVRPGSIVVMRDAHLGIVVGDNEILHTNEHIGAHISHFSAPEIRFSLVGVYDVD